MRDLQTLCEEFDALDPDARLDAALRAHAILTPHSVRLRDGTIGYYAPGRFDLCYTAAVATCLQVPEAYHWHAPYPNVYCLPDTKTQERTRRGDPAEQIQRDTWLAWARWCDAWGLQMWLHKPVSPAPTGRWVGIVDSRDPREQHCLVMHGKDVLFNPGAPPELLKPGGPWLSDITWGIRFAQAPSTPRQR